MTTIGNDTLRNHPPVDKYIARRRLAALTIAGLALVGGVEVTKAGIGALKNHVDGPAYPALSPGDEGTTTYHVDGGDTPWEMARDHHGDETNIYPVVEEIQRQTHVENDDTPGFQVGDAVTLSGTPVNDK